MTFFKSCLVLCLLSQIIIGQDPFINEIHYDDGSGDLNEGVEIIFSSGVDLDCYQVEAYNGSTGALYSTQTMPTSTFTDEGCGFDAVWVPISGLQNGAPDGVAIIFEPSLTGCSTGGVTNVVQFLSYEGSFSATSGTANGVASTDIGVSETNSTSAGTSMQLFGSGTSYSDFTWSTGVSETNGDINASQDFCSTNDVTNIDMTPSDGQLSFSWTGAPGCSDEIIVVASTSSTFVNSPSGDGTSYVADANFGSGTDLGGGEYIVYKGTGTNFDLLSLTNDTEYCITIYNRCGTDWSTGEIVCGTPDYFNTTIKVMAYNILNYPGSTSDRDTAFRKIIHYTNPDIIVVNELISSTGLNSLITELNTTGVSNYVSAPFNDGPDTDNGLIYKNDFLTFVSQSHIATALRDISDYQLSWPNNSGGTTTFNVFSVHLKAGNTTTDENKRLLECQNLTTYLDAMSTNSNIAVGGDFNFYDNLEPAVPELLTTGTMLLEDPIESMGDWHINTAYQNIHTQSTRSATNPGGSGGAPGGLDDRFDFIFINDYVRNGRNGVLYDGNYVSVGNDGNKFDVSIIENLPNTSVPDSIRDALFAMSDHLPVMMDVKIDYLDPSALPVVLNDQNAERIGENVSIKWSTMSELNASHFEIYRSTDASHFSFIGSINAFGSTNELNQYEFIDEQALSAKSYYYIKQVDFNGQNESFKILSVPKVGSKSELTLYPNPTRTDQVNLKGWGFIEGHYRVSVFNNLGQEVFNEELFLNSSNFHKTLILNSLSKGSFTLVFTSDDVIKKLKFVKL